MKLLFLKLGTTLLTLGRASESLCLDVIFIACKAVSAVLHLSHVTKSWKEDKKDPNFELFGFSEDKFCSC